jgi:hypothetical protein
MLYTVDNIQGFSLIAADESVFAVKECIIDHDIAIFTDRTGSFTLLNVLTRNLINKVQGLSINITRCLLMWTILRKKEQWSLRK